METVQIEVSDGIASVMLCNGRVNALDPTVVHELGECLRELETDKHLTAVVLTGKGKFFSFGFNIPLFLSFTKTEFTDYLTRFTNLYRYLFIYPKPVVAAINGHAIAGGCMLALTGDVRVMVSHNAKISLNEITFGSTVFAGSTEMLRFCIGNTNAAQFLYSGAMYSAEDAMGIGLVQEVLAEDDLMTRARTIAADLGSKSPQTFKHIKSLLRAPVHEYMEKQERASIREFADIWYAEPTWTNLKEIKIY